MSAPTNNDGGPAFPGEAGEDGHGFYKKQFGPNGEQNWLALNQGMSLRDWFAGQALNGYLASWKDEVPSEFFKPEYVANTCYGFADAMIAARKGGQGA
jgi:hypothetical protein